MSENPFVSAEKPSLALLCTLVSVAAVADLHAVTFLVDMGINEASLPTPSAGLPPGTWNSYSSSTVKNSSNLKTSTNVTTTVSFIGTGTINAGTAGLGTFDNTTVPAGLAWAATSASTGNQNGAAGDWLYTSNSNIPADLNFSYTLAFAGLTAGNTFSLDMLSSRNTGDSVGFYEYSLDNGSSWSGFTVYNGDGTLATTAGWDTKNTQTQAFSSVGQGYALQRYMNVSNITLTGTTLQVRARDNPNTTGTAGSNYAGINATRLTVVPEPTHTALLCISSLGFVLRRRRN